MNDIVSVLLESMVQSHVFHLRTRSYAAHIALQEYYTQIQELTDDLAEVMISAEGDLVKYCENIKISNEATTDHIKTYFSELIDIAEISYNNMEDVAVQSVMEDILKLMRLTHYKISFLK
ncbi:MAG: DUF5856 family protein [Betaproteobacteria bacterium]